MKAGGTWIFTEDEKKIISSLVAKGKEEQEKNEKFAITDFDSFYSLFTEDEISIMKKYLSIEPKKIGYKLPYLGLEDIPTDIVPIPDQTYILNGERVVIPCQYLPVETYKAYEQMNKAIQKDINKKLLVSYGYRSPARQVFIFFDILARKYNFDFNKTLRRVCFPAYSEHVYAKRQAIDFRTEDGTPSEDFDKTDEYQWLKRNAKRFGFFESYPKKNSLDMMYEPWHWHHELKH